MALLPVNALFGGLQPDGHWSGTPSVIVRLMEHPDTAARSDVELDGAFPLPEWDFDPANEVTLAGLLARRPCASGHFASIGHATLGSMACSYRERHVIIVGREPGRHDLAPLVRTLITAGRTVQVESTGRHPIDAEHAWVTLRSLPCREQRAHEPEIAGRANEVLGCIRWRSDLERVEAAFSGRSVPVYLQPSAQAEPHIYRQCLAMAMRHPGWRVRSGLPDRKSQLREA